MAKPHGKMAICDALLLFDRLTPPHLPPPRRKIQGGMTLLSEIEVCTWSCFSGPLQFRKIKQSPVGPSLCKPGGPARLQPISLQGVVLEKVRERLKL